MVRKHSGRQPQQARWEVRVMFEPSRLAQHWLQQAYEQVVPLSLYTPMPIGSTGCNASSPSPFEASQTDKGGIKR